MILKYKFYDISTFCKQIFLWNDLIENLYQIERKIEDFKNLETKLRENK